MALRFRAAFALLGLAVAASARAEATGDVPRVAEQNDRLALSPPRFSAAADVPPEEPSDGSVAAGFADFGLRAGEGVLLGASVSLLWSSARASTTTGDRSGVVFFGGATAVVALVAPAIDALVVSSIGDASKYRHPVRPLLVTSYLSQLVVDAAVIASMAVGLPVLALVVYAAGSMGGAAAMGIVHDRAREEQPPLLSWEVATPANATSGTRGYQVAF
jgi:hypothetical protein